MFAFVALLHLCQESRGGHGSGKCACLLALSLGGVRTSKSHCLLLNLHVFYGCFGEQCSVTGGLKPFSLKTLFFFYFPPWYSIPGL